MAKVLVADDSMAVRKVAERHLIDAGLEVMLAANGQEAMDKVTQEQPDIIVCDVIMPDRSGYDVCTFARAQASLAGTPFLLISGIVNPEVKQQAEACGADAVLKKPFQGTSLKDQVLELLANGSKRGDPTSAGATSSAQSEPGLVSAEQAEALSQATAKIEELTAALVGQREQTIKLTQQLDEMQQLRKRLSESEAALEAERVSAAELLDQLTSAEQATSQVKEMETIIQEEREVLAKVKLQLAEAEQVAGRVEELETLLADECEQTARLTEQIAVFEQTAGRVEELETRLSGDSEQLEHLAQKLAQAEQDVAEAREREQEATRKLAQIANLSKH